jgi:EmrB/QacA subfamily drug resistance transporter
MPLTRDKLFTLTGVLLALFLGALDQTIVATALPRIVQDLQGLERFSWVATSYLVASTALVPVYGKLADMYSRKKIELVAVWLFLAGSVLCGLAGEFGDLPLVGDGMNQLILFRAVQGMGGAGLFALAFIIIADLFPPAERGKYQGFVGATFGLASVLGPYAGGLLTDYGSNLIPGVAGWRWVFYVNVPFGALALWFIVNKMPVLHPAGPRRRLDYLSALLLVGGLIPLVIALQLDKTRYGWTSPATLGLFGLSAVSIVLFYLRSVRSDNPILNLTLFGNRVFSTANAAMFLLGAALMGIAVFLPLFMVNVLGVSATRAGVSLIPLSLGMFVGSVGAGQLVARLGNYKILLLAGGLVLLVGVFLLSGLDTGATFGQVSLYMLICGLGLGPSMPLYTLAIQNAVPLQLIGQATSAGQFFPADRRGHRCGRDGGPADGFAGPVVARQRRGPVGGRGGRGRSRGHGGRPPAGSRGTDKGGFCGSHYPQLLLHAVHRGGGVAGDLPGAPVAPAQNERSAAGDGGVRFSMLRASMLRAPRDGGPGSR